MKSFFYVLVFFLLNFWNTSFSQNYIPNAGFEIYDTCPNQLLKTAQLWQNIEYHADYFNSCAPFNISSVPNNYFGQQPAHSGCGYNGLYSYDWSGPSFREAIQTKLDTALVSGIRYFVSFYLSLSDANPNWRTGTNKFGCKLSVNSFGSGMTDGSPAIDNTANFYSDSIVTDTAGWVYICGSFIADSAYNYIAFGCFFDSAHVQHSDTGIHLITYYYIDDVCLSPDSLTCISISQSCYTPNGVEEHDKKNSLVFPNPFNNELKVSMSHQNDYSIQLFNIFGARVFTHGFSLSAEINTAKLTPGLYFYKITDRAGKEWSGKVLKE